MTKKKTDSGLSHSHSLVLSFSLSLSLSVTLPLPPSLPPFNTTHPGYRQACTHRQIHSSSPLTLFTATLPYSPLRRWIWARCSRETWVRTCIVFSSVLLTSVCLCDSFGLPVTGSQTKDWGVAGSPKAACWWQQGKEDEHRNGYVHGD